MKRIVIIFNERSGPTNRLEEIRGFGFEVREVTSHESAAEIAKDLVREKYDVIIGAGGDGTLNSIAAELIGTDIAFGILPTGTLNHLAKDLGIPLDLNSAASLIEREHDVIIIDAGICNGKVFLNNSGLGIYPRIVTLREKFQKNGHVKWRAHLLALLQVIRKIPKFFIDVKIGKETISKKTSFVFVGNNAYGLGGLTTGKRDSLCDGKLSLWVSHRTSFWGLVELLVRALIGNVKEHEDFDVFEGEELTVTTRKRYIDASFDGEIARLKSPLRYKILPKCLKVIVPLKEQ